MMKHARYGLPLLALLLMLGAAGCSDMLLSEPEISEAEAITARPATAKLRNAHMLEQAMRTTVGKSGGRRMGLVMGMGRGLDKQRVLDRYKILQRYKVLTRYEYDRVFNGMAIEIEDLLGLEDFEEILEALAADPDVEWIEPDYLLDETPSGDAAAPCTQPWGLAAIGADEVDRREARAVDIYVIDSGVSNHDLSLTSAYDFTSDATSDDDDDDDSGLTTAMDVDGHGTHVAATIAAPRDKDCGTDGVLSRESNLHSLKVVGDDGTAELSTTIAAVEHVLTRKMANPARPAVVNMSLGADVGTSDENAALDEAVEAALANGVVFVISAGNHGTDVAGISPAHVEGAITVGAYDADFQFAPFSNYGSGVDILAPGVDVVSLSSEADAVTGERTSMSGTSMAAAYVSGAVALFLEKNPHASPRQVRDALVGSGRDGISGAPAGTTTHSLFIGAGGLLDVALPPFFQYALMAGDEIELDQVVTVSNADAAERFVNPSLFTNGNLELKRDGSRFDGFGYAGNDVKPAEYAARAFQPTYNPQGLAGFHEDVQQIALPEFFAEDLAHLATRVTSDDLVLIGHYELGTYEQPLVWYIDGKVETEGPTTFSGYGLLLVREDVKIKHSVETLGTPEDTRLGLFAEGKIEIKTEEPLVLSGDVFTADNLLVEGSLTLTGSLTTLKTLKIKDNDTGPSTIRYRRPSSVLTDLVWPMQ